MRKLVLFAAGFTAACLVGVYFLSGHWLLLAAACCLIAGIPLWCIHQKATRMAAWLLTGCLIGSLWTWAFDALYLSGARAYDGKVVQTQIEVSDYCYDTDYGVAAEGRMALGSRNYRVKFYVNEDTFLHPGDRVTGRFRLRYTADGGEQAPTYHQGKGIFLIAYGRSEMQVTQIAKTPVKYFAAEARYKILTRLDALFPEDTAGFARALLLGDSSKLTYEQDSAFQTSGIRHVIAVSGLHVSILFSVIYVFGGRQRVLGVVLGIPVLLCFAAIAGFTPSIIRACIMQGLMSLSLFVDKEYDPLSALAFSVLVILAVNPLSITATGFQLSVGCVLGITLFARPIQEYLRSRKLFRVVKGTSLRARLTRWFTSSVAVSLSTMITTVPLCAFYFGKVSLVGVLTNLLTLWCVSFIFYGIMAALIVSAIWLPLGQAIAWVISWLIRYVMTVTNICAKLPMAAVYTFSIYILIWLILCYVLLTVFFLSKKKHPGILAACMAATLCVCAFASWLEPRLDDFRFTVLDVGQGQCLILQCDGKTYMVDCGSDRPEEAADRAADVLLSQGIRRLDGLILTHYDSDHAGDAQYLLSRVRADALYLPVTDDQTGMASFDERYSDSIAWIRKDTVIADNGIQITLYPAAASTSDNESSMCVLCQVDNCDILITGDRTQAGERRLLEDHDLPDLEILVVGHHGSKTATSLDLLQATTPDAAVISVGAENNYGHPAKETLDRLHLFGCYIYRTDEMGSIVFKG